jgi:tetratricopeptide (TPR) repeat protein
MPLPVPALSGQTGSNDINEDEELAALRSLLSSGPRTNRMRPAALAEPATAASPAPAQPQGGGANSAARLLQLLQDRSGLDEARPMLELELRTRDQRLGPTHPDTLLSVTCLAMLLQAQGELAEAKPLYQRALEGFEEKYGPTHRDTLISVNNLAVLLKAMGKLDEAKPLYHRVLNGDKEQLGSKHPHTLDSIYNLARLYQAEGNLASALPLFREEVRDGLDWAWLDSSPICRSSV